jgi:hypothetical protein
MNTKTIATRRRADGSINFDRYRAEAQRARAEVIRAGVGRTFLQLRDAALAAVRSIGGEATLVARPSRGHNC